VDAKNSEPHNGGLQAVLKEIKIKGLKSSFKKSFELRKEKSVANVKREEGSNVIAGKRFSKPGLCTA